MKKLILASQSPRRRELIKKISENVEFKTSEADESINWDPESPEEVAAYLAEKKAQAVYNSLNKEEQDDSIVIGSDTVVALGKEIFGKPEDERDAAEILGKLSGRPHAVITAVCLIKKVEGKPVYSTFTEKTIITFKRLSDKEISDYIATGDPFDKAGAYGIQNLPEGFVEKIEGDYYNVVGLPVEKLRTELEYFV